MANLTQCSKVLAYMDQHNEITQRDALGLGIYRLASRISDLKNMGYPIISELRKVQKADGSFTRIAVYSIEKGDNNGGTADVR